MPSNQLSSPNLVQAQPTYGDQPGGGGGAQKRGYPGDERRDEASAKQMRFQQMHMDQGVCACMWVWACFGVGVPLCLCVRVVMCAGVGGWVSGWVGVGSAVCVCVVFVCGVCVCLCRGQSCGVCRAREEWGQRGREGCVCVCVEGGGGGGGGGGCVVGGGGGWSGIKN